MKKILPLLLVILLTIPALLPLIHKGFFVTDDGSWMIIRFSAFYEALRHGQFPVRFLMRLNNGYGYPVADFLYPLFMYVGTPVHILGVSFINTIKLIFGLSLLASSVFTYFWLRKFFSKMPSIIGSLMYLYFPYHLFDMNIRGSTGEVLALGIIPFIFWQLERKSILWSSIGLALLILAHNILAFLFLPFIIGYVLIKKYPLVKIGMFLFLSLGISAFFWLPALSDRQFTVFNLVQVSNFAQYFLTQKNSILIGLPIILAISQAAYYWFTKRNTIILYFLTVTCVLFFLLLPASSFIWKSWPLTPLIQFPWRLLSLFLVTSSFLVAYVIENTKKYQIFLTTVYVLLIGFSALPYLSAKTYQYYPDSYYSTNQDTTTVQNEYMPKWVKNIPTQQADKIVFLGGKGSITNLITTSNKTSAIVQLSKKDTVRINTVYFPGWEVFVDGKIVTIDYQKAGFLDVSMVAGSHTILAKFNETPIRMISNIISVVAILGIVILRKRIQYV